MSKAPEEAEEVKPHLVANGKTGRDPVIRAADLHGYEKMGLPEFVSPDHIVTATPAPQSKGAAPASRAASVPASAAAPTPGGEAEPEPVMPVLDEAELARLREEGYQVGYRRGHEEGVEAGHKVGYQQGRQDGQKAGHQVGEEAGFAEGLQKGELQAREATEQEVRDTLSTLQSAIGKLVDPSAQQEESVVHEVVSLVMTVAEHVVQRELHYDSTQITQVVRGALGALPPSAEGVRIHLHQRDIERIESLRRDLGEGWQVVVDTELSPGGCRVETLDSIVDATTEQRMRQCVEQLAAEFLHEEPQAVAEADATPLEVVIPDEPQAVEPEAVTLEGDLSDEPSSPDPEHTQEP